MLGLVDGRVERHPAPPGARTDARVIEAIREEIDRAAEKSTRTRSWFLWQVEQQLIARYGLNVVPMPSRATFYRLFDQLSRGKHTTGSARTRRSLANQPATPFSELPVSRPGELGEIDSTPLDVDVLLDDGVPGRVELTGMVDVATRTVTAAVLRPTVKSVDASLLLARTLTPEPMRPGWADVLRMARSALPYRRMLSLDQRLEHAAAKPVIVPEAIVFDHAQVYVSANFRQACRSLGINLFRRRLRGAAAGQVEGRQPVGRQDRPPGLRR